MHYHSISIRDSSGGMRPDGRSACDACTGTAALGACVCTTIYPAAPMAGEHLTRLRPRLTADRRVVATRWPTGSLR